MNQVQKAYNSYEKTNIMLKITENLYHQRNLYLIKNRKSQYNSRPTQGIHSQKDDLMRQFRIQKENEFLYSKLRNISNRQPKPQINDLFLKSEAKKKQFNLKVKDFEREAIQRENAEMFKRMSMLKSFINTKALDEEYKTEHQKMVSKIRKINQGTTLLPSIYKTTNNRSKICKTEANKVEESKAEENKKEEPQNNKPQEQQNKDHCETAQN